MAISDSSLGKKTHIEMDITLITLETFGCPDVSGHLY